MNQINNKIIMKGLQFNIPFSLISLLGFFLLFTSCEKEVPQEKIFVNIEITQLPDKTTFQLGETPEFTGIEVSEVYTDGTQKPNTNFNISWSADIFKRGTTQATVTARERSATFEISFDGDLIDTGLPVVYIETEDRTPVDSKDNYVNATMMIKEDGKKVFDNSLRIRGRGNATWTYSKKPYKLKLDDKASILGMEGEKDWVLLANYCDKTLLRTGIALELSRLMNFPYTADDRFVEVVLNGEYIGNYQLVEAIEQGSDRVDIPESGYLFEKDGYYLQEPNYFVSSMGHGYSFKNPDPEEDLTIQQWEYIKNYMDEFEAVLSSAAFNDPGNGYTRFIDVPSFVRWFIFQNILANMDTNVYLVKSDMGDSKVEMGPVWDFEWSVGIGWYEGARPRPANYYVWNSNAFYYDRLLQDPLFKTKVREMWGTISITEDILQYIDETAVLLEKSQELNFKRWDIMNIRVSVGGIPMGSYEKEVECDRQFFINHMNWLNDEISNY
ncbi:CotH kinase family protein [uncultured Proteiniphilum sp.]|uniref:CotH kinase family protein n=1 Tax=uncultured Proteiniphilum sp. TaxID=497637 RepID=UPI002609B207|nr:CotH kinase family protein [uncultured Proteiniphilum sp.]